MASQSNFSTAMTNRSLRIIRTELEFLADASVITPQQVSSILSQLPKRTQLDNDTLVKQPQPTPPPAQPPVAAYFPPTDQFANTSLNEKAPIQNQYANTSLNEKAPVPNQYPSPVPPPPAYAQTPPILSTATALYAYAPTDAGDLALQPHDRIQVLEHMNNDWWRGRNERTGLEGIFPRSYVSVVDEKAGPSVAVPQPTNYGNMPLEVSQSGSSASPPGGKQPSKFETNGKKFGKKLGNAAIFGAGATIGSNIVNSIF